MWTSSVDLVLLVLWALVEVMNKAKLVPVPFRTLVGPTQRVGDRICPIRRVNEVEMQHGRVVELDSSATLTILVRKVTFSPDCLGEKSRD